MIREQGNWHFLFKFKSNSRNNRRDKCDVLAELCTGQDHCHSWGAPHGHVGLIFINISRQAGRPGVLSASVLVASNCHHASLNLDTIWYNSQTPGRRDIQNSQHYYYGPRMNVNINNLHWMRLERMLGVWVRVVSRQWMLTPKSQASTISHPIFSLVAIKFCGCRAAKASSLLSMTFVLSLEARLEDGLHWIIIVTWSVNSKMYLQL